MIFSYARRPEAVKKISRRVQIDKRDLKLSMLIQLIPLIIIILLSRSVSAAEANKGEALFTANCASCHSTIRPVARPTIDERLNEEGPNLWYAGSKYKEGFLSRWLQDPAPLRGMEYNSLLATAEGTHMALGGAEAVQIAAYLMELKSPDVIDIEIKAKTTARGRFVFIKKLGCYGCHTIKKGSRVVGGLTGPTLLGASERLKTMWIYSYMKNPQTFTPRSPMPNYSHLLSEVKLKALAAYIAAQK